MISFLRTGAGAGICCVLIILAGTVGARAEEVGIVAASALNVRPIPGKTRPPLVTLPKGTRVKILAHHGKWLAISHQGRKGYVRNKERYIHTVILPEPAKVKGIDPARLQEEAERVSRKIDRHREQVQAYSRQAASVLDKLNRLDQALNKTRRRAEGMKIEMTRLQDKIVTTTCAANRLASEIRLQEENVAKRLTALYKFVQTGRFQVWASVTSIHDFMHNQAALQRILAHDDMIRENLIRDQARLQNLLSQLNARQKDKCIIEKNLKDQLRLMSREKSERAEFLAQIRSRQTGEKRLVKAFTEVAAQLDRRIESLGRASAALPPGDPHGSMTPDTVKGLPELPVRGKVIGYFGAQRDHKYAVVKFRSGIDIQSDRGEPIRSVGDGRVIYADWFKGYGNMIIIDHGNTYCTVYANAEELFKEQGDPVESGEVIATVGDTGSMIGPKLHFELRHHGKPIDPLEWLKEKKGANR